MSTFLVSVGFFIVMSWFMAFALWFSRYKQDGRACCSTGIEDIDAKLDPCLTCPRKESVEECDGHVDGEVCEKKDAGSRPARDAGKAAYSMDAG